MKLKQLKYNMFQLFFKDVDLQQEAKGLEDGAADMEETTRVVPHVSVGLHDYIYVSSSTLF